MKNCIFTYVLYCITVTSVVFLSFNNGYPLGVGFSTTAGTSISTINLKPERNSSANYILGGGFVLDTAVAKIQRFNYRLYIGYENIIESGVDFNTKWSMNRISLSNVFGFSLFSIKYFRIWLGPQVEIAYQFKKSGKFKTSFIVPTFIEDYTAKNFAIKAAILNFGGVLGINFNPGSLFTISFELGMQIGMGILNQRSTEEHLFKSWDFWTGIESRYPYQLRDQEDTGYAKIESFMRLSFIFRVGDVFISHTPSAD